MSHFCFDGIYTIKGKGNYYLDKFSCFECYILNNYKVSLLNGHFVKSFKSV